MDRGQIGFDPVVGTLTNLVENMSMKLWNYFLFEQNHRIITNIDMDGESFLKVLSNDKDAKNLNNFYRNLRNSKSKSINFTQRWTYL